MEREELVMTIRAFRAIHIIGSRLNSFPSCDLSSNKLQLLKFHGMKKIFKKFKDDKQVKLPDYAPKQNIMEAVTLQMEDLNTTCIDHSTQSPETIQPFQEPNNISTDKDESNVILHHSNETTEVNKRQKPLHSLGGTQLAFRWQETKYRDSQYAGHAAIKE
ncbi:Disheveled-associated activator of morphogenesis 1 [Galdieria sulphuraria]|nr:Disheveled-associated activator of morphogenesis 1 [Galdieria sulphuraria]